MAHVTFIHGISNKPPANVLIAEWRQALAANGGIDLDRQGVTSSMVYWADVLYPLPEMNQEAAAGESDSDLEVLGQLAAASRSAEDGRFLAGLAGKLSIAALRSSAAIAVEEPGRNSEERVPLPWVVKEPLMSVLLRDVHHYLFNERFSPLPGKEYWVRDEIRQRFVRQLSDRPSTPGPHIVVAHSMGTVIAYDCLLRVAECPRVDALMTIGSPLGLDEIQDKMQPEWTRNNGFPAQRVGTWINVYDSLDPVAGFDPALTNDYRRDGRRSVVDISESNWGWWRHDISKYLRGPQLRSALRTLLQLPSAELASESVIGRSTAHDSVRQTGRDEAMSWTSAADVESWLLSLQFSGRPASEAPAKVGVRRRNAKTEALEESVRQSAEDSEAALGLMGEFREAVAQIQAEAGEQGAAVMSSPRNRLSSLIQSELAASKERLSISTLEEIPFDTLDTKDVLQRIFERAGNVRKRPQKRPMTAVPQGLPDHARILLVSDFGTGLYGAPVIAATAAAKANFDLMLHLGDIYYSGTEEEVQSRFLAVWPKAAGDISRTLNGNHDMYSGGYGYFDVALPAFEQPSSYFAMQNRHWLLVGLDTAYHDNDINSHQVQWLNQVLEQAGSRKLLLFSHHPLFSDFKSQGTKVGQRLANLLDQRRITAWYWGHEHHAVVFDEHPIYGFHARCVGNGGMPASRKDIREFPVAETIDEFSWRRGPGLLTPPSLYLDGPNKFVSVDPDKYGPHGFATIELSGAHATEAMFTADGVEVFLNQMR